MGLNIRPYSSDLLFKQFDVVMYYWTILNNHIVSHNKDKEASYITNRFLVSSLSVGVPENVLSILKCDHIFTCS
jgi:hypothetical protein